MVLVVGVYLFNDWRRGRTLTPAEKDEVLAEDRAVLRGRVGANEYQVYAALVRLSAAGDRLAFKEAVARVDADSEWVRAGAAEALGRSSDPKMQELLVRLTSDKSALVREKAIRAVGYRPELAGRHELLTTLLARHDVGEAERVQALRALVLVSAPAERAKWIGELVALARRQRGPSELNTWLELTGLAPRDASVIEAMDKLSRDVGADADLRALAIRHLAASSPEHVRTRIYGLHRDGQPKIRAAAVQSLVTACPIERDTILREVLGAEKDALVWRLAVQTAASIPTAEVIQQLRRAKSVAKSADDIGYVERSLAALERAAAAKMPDPCALSSATGTAHKSAAVQR